jgi:hypothetical protein
LPHAEDQCVGGFQKKAVDLHFSKNPIFYSFLP